jgi:hypothetical protein
MANDVPDRLLGCPTCSGFFRWIDDIPTLKEHAAGGYLYGPECPGSGTEGIDLGPRELYKLSRGGLVFEGSSTDPVIAMICPHCWAEQSVREPPDGAVNRKLRVSLECPGCHWGIRLSEMRMNPQGVWAPRSMSRR